MIAKFQEEIKKEQINQLIKKNGKLYKLNSSY